MPDRPQIDAYLAHLSKERRLSPHTASNYARDLRALADFAVRASLEWKNFDSQHVRMFAARSHAGGLSPRSVQRRLSAVRGFFNYLVRERVVPNNPAVDVRAESGEAPARDTRCRFDQPAARHS
jgi:integrase/recombinase XerC